MGAGRAEGLLVLKPLTRLAALVIVVATGALLWAASRHGAGGHVVRLDEWHHLYLGLALAGWALRRGHPWLLVVAALIAADDGWQHATQALGDWGYVSPLHHLFGVYLWPYAAVRWMVARLDALFG